MKKVRVGVLGAHRGRTMIGYCKQADNAELVAVCDKAPYELEKVKREAGDLPVTYYESFDEFLKHDMDAVVLANYANEHAPFAIRCLEAGYHVFSEVLPFQTMAEAVALAEAVEKSGKIYAYGENYCWMAAPREMRRLYRDDRIGELEYAECEYVHNCEPIWHEITYGEPDHWRNNMYSTFYCTHSLGPILHATGLRPVKVTGMESSLNRRRFNTGSRAANLGMELVTLANGAIVKSIHGGLYKNSVWYCMYGDKGRMESAREDANAGGHDRVYVNADAFPGDYDTPDKVETYLPAKRDKRSIGFGHGGSDFYSMYYFIERIRGDETADVIGVYEALDMCMCGHFAFRSILEDGRPMEIPDLRDPAQRDRWRYDTACTDPKTAGDMLLPTQKGGTPDIPLSVYADVKRKWEAFLAKREAEETE